MVEVPRAKGQFLQAGMVVLLPAPSGAVVSHDGTLAMNTLVQQDDYPVLFSIIGTAYNQVGLGDDNEKDMRTPPAPSTIAGYEWRIRF